MCKISGFRAYLLSTVLFVCISKIDVLHVNLKYLVYLEVFSWKHTKNVFSDKPGVLWLKL